MVAETKRTPRIRKQVKEAKPSEPTTTQFDSTAKVESALPTTPPVASAPAVPAPAPPAPRTASPLEAAAQAVVAANLQGAPLALTRGFVSGRESRAQLMSEPPWVGVAGAYHGRSGRELGQAVVWLAIQQAIPVPGAPEFQAFGADHISGGEARLQKPLTITVAEGRNHLVPADRAVMEQVQDALMGRDLFLVSLDRLRPNPRTSSGKPVSDGIILEAYDPTTGGLVWQNPRITVAHAIAACLHGAALAPSFSVPTVAPVSIPAPALAPTPVPSVVTALLPVWFVKIKAEAESYGMPATNTLTYIINKRAEALLSFGAVASMEEALSTARPEVAALMAPVAAPVPALAPVSAPIPVPVPVPAPAASLASTEGVAAALGVKPPVVKAVAPKPVAPVVTVDAELPEELELDHLLVREWRPKVQERILKILADAPDHTASAQQIREALGLRCGFKSGDELERIGTAIKRTIRRIEAEGLLIGTGLTKGKTYRLL